MKSLSELFSSGGPVMFAIAGVSLTAWYLTLRSWLEAGSLRKRLLRTSVPLLKVSSLRNGARTAENLSNLSNDRAGLACFVMEHEATRLKRTLSLIGTLAAVLPLLGLLGTVLGMLVSFEVIQCHGTSQPRLLAGGIGQALMTTQAGLWAAVPVLFFHHVIRGRSRVISNELSVLAHVMQAARDLSETGHRPDGLPESR